MDVPFNSKDKRWGLVSSGTVYKFALSSCHIKCLIYESMKQNVIFLGSTAYPSPYYTPNWDWVQERCSLHTHQQQQPLYVRNRVLVALSKHTELQQLCYVYKEQQPYYVQYTRSSSSHPVYTQSSSWTAYNTYWTTITLCARAHTHTQTHTHTHTNNNSHPTYTFGAIAVLRTLRIAAVGTKYTHVQQQPYSNTVTTTFRTFRTVDAICIHRAAAAKHTHMLTAFNIQTNNAKFLLHSSLILAKLLWNQVFQKQNYTVKLSFFLVF